MPDDREPLGRLVHQTRRDFNAGLEKPFGLGEWEDRHPKQRELDMRIGAAVEAAVRERIAADPETPLSDALHTLGEVQRIAESMVMSRNPMERECGRRVLGVIGPQGDEEPALPGAADPAPPQIDGQLPLPGTEPGHLTQTRPWPYDGPEGRARLTGSLDTGGSFTGDDNDDPEEPA